MRNVNILTIHKEPNYGAVLQAYALYRTIERLGHNPRIINLSMDYRRFPYTLKYRLLLPVYKRLKGYDYCFSMAEKFSREHCPCQIGDFYTMKELAAFSWDKDDYYLIGSDQVWNPDITQNLRSAFTFSFLHDDAKNRYAYAASLGNIRDEKKRAEELDLEKIKKFKRIAVREQFGVDFLKHYSILAIEVIDPTLLLDDYSNLFRKEVRHKEELLFLSLSDTQEMNEFVKTIATGMNLPIKKHYGYLQPERDKNKRFIPIEEWLYDIACAKMVITDSFHATVFSILFRRPFLVYISEPSKVFRISNLLDNLGIKGRIVSSKEEADEAIPIDYEMVRNKLVVYREKSMNYLKSILA